MKSEEYVCCISFPWDCSSIGQSTALSRRKLRVRAPSVPTNPINNNPIKKIHQFISSFSVKGVQIAEFRSQRGSLLLFYIIYRFFIYFLYFRFSSKQIQIWSFSFLQLVSMEMDKDTCGLVQLLVASYSGF